MNKIVKSSMLAAALVASPFAANAELAPMTDTDLQAVSGQGVIGDIIIDIALNPELLSKASTVFGYASLFNGFKAGVLEEIQADDFTGDFADDVLDLKIGFSYGKATVYGWLATAIAP